MRLCVQQQLAQEKTDMVAAVRRAQVMGLNYSIRAHFVWLINYDGKRYCVYLSCAWGTKPSSMMITFITMLFVHCSNLRDCPDYGISNASVTLHGFQSHQIAVLFVLHIFLSCHGESLRSCGVHAKWLIRDRGSLMTRIFSRSLTDLQLCFVTNTCVRINTESNATLCGSARNEGTLGPD